MKKTFHKNINKKNNKNLNLHKFNKNAHFNQKKILKNQSEQENFNLKKKNRNLFLLKKYQPKTTYYLHTNQKIKQGIFLKKPFFHEIQYPFPLNLKLIHEYLKKK